MAMAVPQPKSRRWLLWLVVAVAVVGLLALMVEDWHQLWKISSAPDNVPIVGMIPLVIFFTWLGLKQSKENDELVRELEEDPALAKTHHRKTQPWRPGWARELHVWPYLVRIEFLAAIIVTASRGNRPIAVSSDNMTASVPSSTAFATSVTSARVGRGLSCMERSI